MDRADEELQGVADEVLVSEIKAGSRVALETLVSRYQPWIYNLALRMVYSPQDAADVTQEVLMRVVRGVASFEGRSAVRTWIYRVVVNHVINMKARPLEKMVTSFAKYGATLDEVPELDLPDEGQAPTDVRVMVKEAKVACMTGMLLCLDRRQRLVFVLGELLGVSDVVGAEVLDVSRAGFRQALSRARRDLYQFMNDKCGLVKSENPCRCARKTRGFIQLGLVDPARLVFAQEHLAAIRDKSPARADALDGLEAAYAALFREHPYLQPAEVPEVVRKVVESEQVVSLFDLR